MKKHTKEFEFAAYRAIQKVAKVTHLRIQKFHTTFQDSQIFFIFSLREKVLKYGKVPVPLNDVSLEDAEFHLRIAVQNGDMKIEFSLHKDKFMNPTSVLIANKNGFFEIQDPLDGYYTLKNVYHPKGYTGGNSKLPFYLFENIFSIIFVSLINSYCWYCISYHCYRWASFSIDCVNLA